MVAGNKVGGSAWREEILLQNCFPFGALLVFATSLAEPCSSRESLGAALTICVWA